MLAAASGFAALGIWQVERRAWKHALIERVEARVHAPATAPPPPSQWSSITAQAHEYLHVRLQGTLLHRLQALVQASTRLGTGSWVVTPLQQSDGSIVLVNRGFVSSPPAPAADEPIALTGLLRISEPGGGFLRHNDPGAGRWYSRDVAAIAASRGLGLATAGIAAVAPVAPFFVDADAAPCAPACDDPTRAPVGGLTVIAFRDHHLLYALTWFTLCGMSLAAAVALRRMHRRSAPADG